MSIELDILKELGTISATQIELASIARQINTQMRGGDFLNRFNKIVGIFDQCYAVVTDNLRPLASLQSEADLAANFTARHEAYSQCYLMEISKPRTLGEDAYLDIVELQHMKEYKTRFPLLQRSINQFHQYYDKWIDNDAWLAMSIDILFKRIQVLLKQIAEVLAKDSEDAWLIYQAAFTGVNSYLDLIEQWRIAADVADSERVQAV